MTVRRGDIYYADLSPVIGSEQGGVRPVLVIQNDVGNKHSPTVICAAITSRMNKAKLPTHIEISAKKIPACEKFSGTSGADQNIGQKAAEGVYLPCGRNIYGRSQ